VKRIYKHIQTKATHQFKHETEVLENAGKAIMTISL